jgi:hypothetical protein
MIGTRGIIMLLKGKTQAQVDRDKQIADWNMVISDSKKDLAETDWVSIKLNEYRITNPDDYATMLEKYKPILDARDKMRQDINTAEQKIKEIEDATGTV